MPVNRPTLWGAVEGLVDEAVLRRLISQVGADAGTIHNKGGKGRLLQQIHAYNHAARFRPWVILLDLDRDADCAPSYLRQLPEPSPHLCLRIAVRAVEAWLLADREHFSSFFAVPAGRIPSGPDDLNDPKRSLVDLARYSRRKDIRQDLVPRPESGRSVGPAYSSRLLEFIRDSGSGWRPDAGAERSQSLRRCLRHLERLAGESSSQSP